MSVNKVELESKGIKRALKNYSAYDAIVEYIWNGFDAEATHVDVQLINSTLNSISEIQVIDNGYGINKDSLALKFKPVFESNKIIDRIPSKNSSTTHGKNGVGRFTFFTFSDFAEWTTIYTNEGKNYKYTIEINSNELEKYIDSDIILTENPTGTIARFFNFNSKIFNEAEFHEYLILEFAWFLELNKNNNYSLTVSGKPLEYSKVLKVKENVIDKRLTELQAELLKLASSKADYEKVGDEIYRLREEKQKAQVENLGRDEMQKRITDMSAFLKYQPIALVQYDEALVRRLIEKVTVYEDKFTVEFKSGVTVDIE